MKEKVYGELQIKNMKVEFLNFPDRDEYYYFAFVQGINKENQTDAKLDGLYLVELVRYTTTTRKPIPVVKIIEKLHKPYVVSLATLVILPKLSDAVINAICSWDAAEKVRLLHLVLNEKPIPPELKDRCLTALEEYKEYFDDEDYEYFKDYIKNAPAPKPEKTKTEEEKIEKTRNLQK